MNTYITPWYSDIFSRLEKITHLDKITTPSVNIASAEDKQISRAKMYVDDN